MKSRDRIAVSLSASALALAMAFSPAAQAQESTQKATPESAQATTPETAQAQAANVPTAKPFYRKTQVGSNIARVRNDESLPVSEYDRTYIDRTGAATTADLLRTIPYVQVGR